MKATARAHANIALVKYWGKRDAALNLPATGSLSLTVAALTTTATVEFTGRGGVFDFLREYNLTLAQALEVSDRLPVWAEFSIYEGGQFGRVAQRSRPQRAPRP